MQESQEQRHPSDVFFKKNGLSNLLNPIFNYLENARHAAPNNPLSSFNVDFLTFTKGAITAYTFSFTRLS